jgi:hypothetical protein
MAGGGGMVQALRSTSGLSSYENDCRLSSNRSLWSVSMIRPAGLLSTEESELRDEVEETWLRVC